MSTLPLYETLIKDCTHEDLTIEEKNEFMAIVKNIDDYGSELMYALIRIYQLENNEDKSTFKIPYGGKYIKNDIKFDLLDLPNQLKQLLYKFLIIHSKSLSFDKTKKASENFFLNKNDDNDNEHEEDE